MATTVDTRPGGAGRFGSGAPPRLVTVGSDPENEKLMRQVARRDSFDEGSLLTRAEVEKGSEWSFDEALETGLRRIREQGRPDAMVAYWDFPQTSLAPLLAAESEVLAPTPEAAARCEHKYWSRCVQAKVIPELIPDFQAFDPFDDASIASLDLPYPYWVKPVMGCGSYLAFRIRRAADLEEAIPRIRDGIGRLARPFDEFLAHLELDPEVRGVGGSWCIAETETTGRQCTVEGWISRGEIGFHGVVDSIREPNRSSFSRYQYPSRLPKRVRLRMFDCLVTLIPALGLDDTPFNVEFFYQPRGERLSLLEVNPRVSQSHAPLFQMVDGLSNYKVICDVAFGRRPLMPRGEGPYDTAAKFFVRHFGDGRVARVPTEAELHALHDAVPTARVRPQVERGEVLSRRAVMEDSYSFTLATLFIGGGSTADLLERFERCKELLSFEIEEVA